MILVIFVKSRLGLKPEEYSTKDIKNYAVKEDRNEKESSTCELEEGHGQSRN